MKELNNLKLNIQMFADGEDGGVNPVVNNNEGGTNPEPAREQTLTELLSSNPKMQSQFDSLLAKSNETAINNAKTKWQEAQSEADKLAKMNDDQKVKYEMNKLKTRNQELENQINAGNLYKQASSIANEKSIPTGYLDLIDFDKETAESVSSKLEKLATIRSRDFEAYLSSRVRQRTPQERSVPTIDPYIEGFNSEF